MSSPCKPKMHSWTRWYVVEAARDKPKRRPAKLERTCQKSGCAARETKFYTSKIVKR